MASYSQIKARIAKLEKEAEQVLRKEAVKAIDSIKKIMEKYQLTLADLSAALSEGGGRGRKPKTAAANGRRAPKVARAAPAAKYHNPKTGETWSGFGRRPAWIRDALAKGKQDKFLINGAGERQPEQTTTAKKPRAVAAKKRRATSAAETAAKPRKSAAAGNSAAAPAGKRSRKSGSKSATKKRASKGAATAPKVSEGVASAAAE